MLFEQYQWPEKQGLVWRKTIQQECTFYKNINNEKKTKKLNKNQNAVPQVFLMFDCIKYFSLSKSLHYKYILKTGF